MRNERRVDYMGKEIFHDTYSYSLIDDCTRFCYVYLLKTKDETLHYFKIYKAKVENQLERKIKRLRSNRGGIFLMSLLHSVKSLKLFMR